MTEYISSDTNVWIDFNAVDATGLPFRLPCTYIMWSDAVEDEVVSPDGLKDRLVEAGLVAVKITDREFFLADDYGGRYPGLSAYDTVALSIAKLRGIVLMTGDLRLRKAAVKEDVAVVGTIGVIDRLLAEGLVSDEEYRDVIQGLIDANGGVVRLPEDELRKRLDAVAGESSVEDEVSDEELESIEAMFEAREGYDNVKTGDELQAAALEYFDEHGEKLMEIISGGADDE